MGKITHNVFIYGTLKKGYPNHDEYLRSEKYLGKYRTIDCFPLVVANKWFAPILLQEPGVGKQVIGELYQVSESKLADLDRLEHTHQPKGYKRIVIEIQSIDKQQQLRVFTYMNERTHVTDISSEYLSEYTDRRYIPMAERKK